MTNSQPPQKGFYGPDPLGTLAMLLRTLAGEKALAHELIQNADDAKDEEGKRTATRINFNVTEKALIVSNDAAFRYEDFERIKKVGSGGKRDESEELTTGEFGIGFVSVYQVTDVPEIHSDKKILILRPEESSFEQKPDPFAKFKGTKIVLPWAFDRSMLRERLGVDPVDDKYINSFVDKLKEALPIAILFLKKLEKIELCRNGSPVSVVERSISDDTIKVWQKGQKRDGQLWRVFKTKLKMPDTDRTDYENRSDEVRVAVPDYIMKDGLLFATLPTEQPTGLPFHIDADFFPKPDRKSIAFDEGDKGLGWNREAIKAAAYAIQSNLINLRDMFKNDATTFWAFLDSIDKVKDDTRISLDEFWKSLRKPLSESPIVYTKSREWLAPKDARILTGSQEEEAATAFQELGMKVVHLDLQKYQNILTNIGVSRVRVYDVYQHLEMKGYADRRRMSSPPVKPGNLELLWNGIYAVFKRETEQLKGDAKNRLRHCALAPGLGGDLWPCRSAFQADEQTRKIFAPLILGDMTFLTIECVPLLEQLCPKFTAEEAIKMLEKLDPEQLEDRQRDGKYDPVAVLRWFEKRKSELSDKDLCDQLVKLPIFPSSAGGLSSLENLCLPGGFKDPLGIANILDTSIIDGLLSFMEYLRVEKLTLSKYAIQYIPEALAKDITNDIKIKKIKQNLLKILEKNIGDIKDDDEVRDKLSELLIVECEDSAFRRPDKVYLKEERVTSILGEQATYAHIPETKQKIRTELYSWLGVKSEPRVVDVLKIIDQATATKPPNNSAAKTVIKMLTYLGRRAKETDFSETFLSDLSELQTKAWLPAEAGTEWYRPDKLFATYKKSIFYSQAKFLDAEDGLQEEIKAFLGWLGLNLEPEPHQVVGHLLWCSENHKPPPKELYRWLDENASSDDLQEMKNKACLWTNGKYVSPDKAFQISHPFGKFRETLESYLLSYQELLKGLEVREKPNHMDVIELLKDIAKGYDKSDEDDYKIVMGCWTSLYDALHVDNSEQLNLKVLQHLKCVPTEERSLKPPSQMFFEDKSGLVDKFEEFKKKHCIQRTSKAWEAMKAAGVRPVSKVIQSDVEKCVNSCEDKSIKERFLARADLIRTILGGTADEASGNEFVDILDKISFMQVDKLMVRWKLTAFDEEQPLLTKPNPEFAHWDSERHLFYFAKNPDGSVPWPAIARELTLALPPNDNPTTTPLVLKSVLETENDEGAEEQLNELGIAIIRGHHNGPDVETTEQVEEEQEEEQNNGGQPPGGRKPPEEEDKEIAEKIMRSEPWVVKEFTRTIRGVEGRKLEAKFRSMLYGDYRKHCQICGNTFRGNELQVNLVHIVPPKKESLDYPTNYYGNILGLCGWHFNLMKYGKWAFIDDRDTLDHDLSDMGKMRGFILERVREEDDEWGKPVYKLPIWFFNVSLNWQQTKTTIKEEIRYSAPHWKYVRELYKES